MSQVMGPEAAKLSLQPPSLPRVEECVEKNPAQLTSKTDMKITIRKTSPHDARVAFEIPLPSGTSAPMEVWRIRSNQDSAVSVPNGIILENDQRSTMAVVVHVSRGDIVVVRQKVGLGTVDPCLYYRIADSYQPCCIVGPDFHHQNLVIGSSPCCIEVDGARPIFMEEADLKELFQENHPRWLQEFVDGQLLQWREHSPAFYVRFAPSERLERDVSLVAIHDPHRALMDYRDRLTWEHFEFCIRRLPVAAVKFAFDRIPQELRKTYLKDHATYILENHLDHLSNTELRTCSWGSPITAFKIRQFLSPRRSAILLSSSYTVAWIGNLDGSGPAFRKEVFDSLSQYPDEWLKSNQKGFESIFKRLRNLLGISFDDLELHEMLEKMAPKYRRVFAGHLAQHI